MTENSELKPKDQDKALSDQTDGNAAFFWRKRGRRETLFSLLAHVLNTSREKFDCQRASNEDRQRWARIIISGVQAYGELLETVDLEDLEERIRRLEVGGENNR